MHTPHTNVHSYLPVGRVGFPSDHLVENILSAIKGVSSKIPQGLRNIQSVNLKTPDSIALPIFNSLPPPPSLLPSLDDKPPTKRVRIDNSLGSEDNDKMAESDTSEDLEPERKRKIVKSQTLGKILVEDPRSVSLMEREAGATNSDEDLQAVGRQKARKSLPGSKKSGLSRNTQMISKVSAKKVRGSTVRSSKYEKALRRRTVN